MSTTRSRTKSKPKAGRPVGSINQFNINLSSVIQDTVTNANRFLHQREIAEALIKVVGKKKVSDKVEFGKRISVLIQALKNRGTLVQHSVSNSTREKYYGKQEWLKRNKPVAGKEPQ